MSLHKIRIDQTRSQHDAGPSHEAHSTSCSRQQAVARSVHILPVLAVLAAKLLLAKQCFVQCARQQLIGARSDATVCARLPELFKAASSSHAQSVCHVLFVYVSMTLCLVQYPFIAQQKTRTIVFSKHDPPFQSNAAEPFHVSASHSCKIQ